MSYLAQALLNEDVDFGRRSRSCITQQANYYLNDTRASFQALSNALLKGDPGIILTFTQIICAGPGVADSVDNGDGTIDSSKVADEELLALVQNFYPEVAALYFQEDGTPVT